MISALNLRKEFGKVTALDGVSFTARDGQVTGLLGPNGAGKSTLLRILYGLLTPDAGSAVVDQISVTDNPIEVQRRIGVLPESHGLYARLTAREHIQYFGELHEMAPAELARATSELIDLLDMVDIADRRAHGFSQGERVKVCLARALVHRPNNIILDEPTNGLDVQSTRSVRELVRQMRRDNRTVLLSSHLMHEVASLCDHIVIISHGRVAAEGTPDQILERSHESDLEAAFVRLTDAPQ